jgi:putative DNA primase/helicase
MAGLRDESAQDPFDMLADEVKIKPVAVGFIVPPVPPQKTKVKTKSGKKPETLPAESVLRLDKSLSTIPSVIEIEENQQGVVDLSLAIDPRLDYKPSDVEIIQQLAELKPLDYDKVRTEQAKSLGVRPATLDAEVKAVRGLDKAVDRLPFPNIEAHHEPIDPARLLDDVAATIRQFIVLDESQAIAAALWVALTYFIDVVEVAPLAIINAPEKSCGKTQLLTVIGRMAYRPLPASNASASALFRAVELWKPTILIDEADTFFRDNTELHGMINAGYLRDGFVLRSEAVGDSFEPKKFSVFSAKALAGIKLEKHLPDATMSRGIIFNLRRKLSGENVSRLRHAEPGLFVGIASKLIRFAGDYSKQVRQARPVLPDALSDREQDNWDGLLAIASCAGSEWVTKATATALTLSAGSSEKATSTGNELLSDIQSIFESKRTNKISTADLIQALCDDEEAPWLSYNRGKPIVPRQLVKQLEAYEIKPKQIRLNSYDRMRGFEICQFADAFMRYLPTPQIIRDNVTKQQEPSNGEALAVTNFVTCHTSDNLSATAKATNGAACHAVTDKKAFSGVGGNEPVFDEAPVFF